MRWPRSVYADSLEELEHEVELHFSPGTTYSIFSIREVGGGEDRVTYRADAHPRQGSGQHRTRSRTSPAPQDGRTRVGARLRHDAGPETGQDAGQPDRARNGSVVAVNPETIHTSPGWSPGQIPTTALQTGPALNAAYGLLMDGAAAGAVAGSPEPDAAGPRSAAVVPVFSTEDPELHEMLDHAAAVPGSPDSLKGPHHPDPLGDSSGPRRIRLVFAGLLDDAVEAAEQTGHRLWSAAGVLNGGRAGAPVVCYGLGDGSDTASLAEGLLRYAPMYLVLAIDPSRKHADTQAWVRRVAAVAEPASVVVVPRTVTGTPGTVRDLGYPLYTSSEVAGHVRR